MEVACGGGRIAVPLAKAGHKVTGFDSDRFMLEKISAKAKKIAIRKKAILSGMRLYQEQ